MTKLPLSKPQPVNEAAQRKLGRQLTDQYKKATKGMVEYIAFGALAQNVSLMINSARGVDTRPGGTESKGTGLKAWLAAYAPDITEPTAYRYIELAEGVRTEFRLGEKADLYQILKAAKPDAKQLALREDINGFVQGKSQRQLLIGFGKFEAQIGGKRVAKTKPPTEAEIREAWLDDAKQRSVSTFSGLHDLQERWKTLDDAQLKVALDDARAFVREADAWLKTPQPSRAALRVEELMKAAEAADQGGKQS